MNTAFARACLLAAAVTACAGAARADDAALDVGGRVRSDWLQQTHSDRHLWITTVEPELTWRPRQNVSVFAKPSFSVSPDDAWPTAYFNEVERSPATRVARFGEHVKVEMKELYADMSLAGGNLRLGKQQIVWGTADGIRVLDVVDPVDLSQFVMADPVDARIALWSVNYRKSLPFADLQVFWSPDHTFNDYSEDPRWYQLTSPRVIPGPPPPGVPPVFMPTQRPSGGLLSSPEYGLRLTKVVGDTDFTFNYLHHFNNDVVVYRRFLDAGGTTALAYVPTYRETHLIGGTFSHAAGQFVYRGEFAYNTDSYVLTRSASDREGVARLGEFSGILGLDWTGLKDTFVSAQLYMSQLRGHTENLVRDRRDTTLTLNVTRDMVQQVWRTELLVIHNLNDRDTAVRARLKYQPGDHVAWRLEYGGYWGKSTGLYGEFRERSRWLAGVDYFF